MNVEINKHIGEKIFHSRESLIKDIQSLKIPVEEKQRVLAEVDAGKTAETLHSWYRKAGITEIGKELREREELKQ